MAGYQLPMDIVTEQQKLQRRQAMIDAIRAQSVTPGQGQMVSGHYVAPGLVGAVGQIAQALIARSGQGRVDEQSKALANRYQQANQDAVGQYLQDRATNPRAAAANAMASGLPALQQMAMKDLEGMVTQKDLLKAPGASLESRTSAVQEGDPSLLQEAPQTVTVNGQVVRVGPKGSETVGDYRDKYGDVTQVGTNGMGQPIIGQPNLSGGKAAYAPSGGVTVNTGVNPVDRAAAPKVIEDIQKARVSIMGAQRANDLADRFTKLVSDPKTITGAFAEPRAMIANIANTLFPGDNQALVKTQQAIKASAELALESSRSAQGQGSVSDYERSLFQKASGGDLNFSPQALADLMAGIKKTAAITQSQSQQFLDNAGSNPLYKPYVEMYKAPGYQSQDEATPITPMPEAAPSEPSVHYIFNPGTGKLEPAR